MQFPSISLIVPIYNEAARVGLMFDGLKDFASQWKGDFELILVDDGSDDGTDILIQQHPTYKEFEHKSRIQYIQQVNQGKGGALKTGVSKASKDFVLTLDADMATSPTELINWLKLKQQFSTQELLIGSRELKESIIQEIPTRKFIGNVFNFIIRSIVGIQIHDTQCGFKLYPLQLAKTIFAQLQTLGWAHDVELLIRAQKLNYSIIEMPVTWNAIPGSKINVVKDSWNMFWEVVRIRRITN